MTTDKNIALITARKSKGLTQLQLAELTGFSRASIINWENGLRSPTVTDLQKLASALGVSADELLPGKTPPAPAAQDEAPNARKVRERLIRIPVLSREFTACCGSGLGAFDITNDVEETFTIPMSDLRMYDTMRPPYAIYVDGDCLESADIHSGDQVIINPAEEPPQGTLVLASIHGMNSIKWYYRLNSGVVALRSDNGEIKLSPEEQEEANFFIQGVVVGIKKPRPKSRPY